MKLSEQGKQAFLGHLYAEAQLPMKIRRSLSYILLANIFSSMHGIICGGGTTAMIGLAGELGAGDLALGIISSVPQIAAYLQIPYSVLVNRTHKRKRYMQTFGMLSRVLWIFFGFIPLMKPIAPGMLPLWTLIFLLGISSACGAFISVCWFPWLSDLLPHSIRGRWLSIREMALSACNVLFGLGAARLLDILPPDIRYRVVFLIGGLCGVTDMLLYSFTEEVYSAPPKKMSIRGIFREVFRNRPFMRLIVMWTCWCFTSSMMGVYLSSYVMHDMGLSFTQIMIFGNIAGAIATILMVPFWGKMVDRYGSRSVLMVTSLLGSLGPTFFLMSTPGNVLPLFLNNFIGTLFSSGAALSINNMQLSYSPDESRPSYIAVFACVTALAGTTLGSLTGGGVLEVWKDLGWFTGFFDRYKMLALVSSLLRFLSALMLVPRMTNDRESGTPKDVLSHLNPFRYFKDTKT